MFMFLHAFHPSPLIIDFGFIAVHWYGFLISLSVVVCFFIGKKLFCRYALPGQLFFDLVFYVLIFGFAGARLWHVLSEYDYYSNHLLDAFKIWQGGLAIHGALLSGVIVIYFFNKKLSGYALLQDNNEAVKQWNNETAAPKENIFIAPFLSSRRHKFLLLLDIFAPLIALGQAIGRFGNYFNQELYGRPVGWGIPIDLLNRLPGYESFEYFHPIFLYESLWCLTIFLLLIFLHRLRLDDIRHKRKEASLFHGFIVNGCGTIFFFYLIFYSLGRFFVGFLRLDPQAVWLNLRLDQWASLALFLVGIIYFVRGLLHHQSQVECDKNS